MKRLVIDASVVVKWLLPQGDESHTDEALSLLHAFREGEVELLQPPHWLAEAGAVLARLEPALAATTMQLLDAMKIPVHNAPEIHIRGIELATELNHHLFDTLYHAVALSVPDTTLVTADLRYFRKAKRFGAICALSDAGRI